MTVLVLSKTKNPHIYKLLSDCIESASPYNVVVVETNTEEEMNTLKLWESKNKLQPITSKAKFIFPNKPFNYNEFLNIGLSYIEDNKIIISNNDVLFHRDCLNILNDKLNDYDSVSPFDTNNLDHKQGFILKEGYQVGKEVTGCCIGLTSNTLKEIGKFDEQFSFWYQDNDYANLLKLKNLKHCLVEDAKITHFSRQSHELIKESLYEMTHGLEKNYNKKWSNK